MLYRTSLLFLLVMVMGSAQSAAEQGRFLQHIALGEEGVLMVAEGEREPRSTGSYSVRLYSVRSPDFPYDNFAAGLVVARDGFIERALLQDLDSDGRPELVVIVRSAGTGGYLSAQSFKIDGDEIALFGQVSDLPAEASPVEHLRQ